MTGTKHSVKVSILGEEFTIRSEVPPDHTRAVAQYLDNAVRQVMHGGGIVESSRAVILAALRITGELFDEREASKQVTAVLHELAGEVRPLLPPAKRTADPPPR